MILGLELMEWVRIDTILVIDAAIKFSYSNEFGSFFNKELGGPVSNVTKALDNESFSFDAWLNTKFFGNFSIGENLSGGIEYPQPCRLSPPINTTNTVSFPGGDCISVNVLMAVICGVGGFHPTHLPLGGAYIRAWHINGSSNRVFLCQLHSILSSESLDLSNWVVLWVEADAPLGSSIR